MNYTIIPTTPQPWYRVVLPWDEYLQVHRTLREQGQHQLVGVINNQMRQTGDGNAYMHLQHAEFEQVKLIHESGAAGSNPGKYLAGPSPGRTRCSGPAES